MSTLAAIRFRVLRRLAPWKLRRSARQGTARDRAFARYHLDLLRTFSEPMTAWSVDEVRPVTPFTETEGTFQVRLHRPASTGIQPGDLLQVSWENSETDVQTVLQKCGAPQSHSFWTPGSVLLPPKRLRRSAVDFLRQHIDLGAASASLQASTNGSGLSGEQSLMEFLDRHPDRATLKLLGEHQPPIEPRLYTLSRVDAGSVEFLVRRGPRLLSGRRVPGRAGGYLSGLLPGNVVKARVLPHPHRLSCCHGYSGGGLVVVTGSAVAGLLCHLRACQSLEHVWVVWGVRDDAHASFVLRELEAAVQQGRLLRLDVARSRSPRPRHVQDLIGEWGADLSRHLAGESSWIYISGHEAMASATSAQLASLPGVQVELWQNQLRWIESASG